MTDKKISASEAAAGALRAGFKAHGSHYMQNLFNIAAREHETEVQQLLAVTFVENYKSIHDFIIVGNSVKALDFLRRTIIDQNTGVHISIAAYKDFIDRVMAAHDPQLQTF